MNAGRVLEDGAFNKHKSPPKGKHPRMYASRDFPVKFGEICGDNHPSNIKRLKVDSTRQLPDMHSDTATYVTPIAAVPLRSFPPTDTRPSRSNVGDVDPMHSDTATYVTPIAAVPVRSFPRTDARKSNEKWKDDAEKLASVISQAKEYMNLFEIKYSWSKESQDDNLPEKSKLEDHKEEVCVLSPTEPEESNDGDSENVDLDLDECAFVDNKEELNNDEEPKSSHNHDELINLTPVQSDESHRSKMREALKMFEEQYKELMHEYEFRGPEKAVQSHVETATRLKSKGMWVSTEKPFGHIPGVEIGDAFGFRAELSVIGLHHQFVSGIDEVTVDGKKFATSIINSGRYENNAKGLDILIYSGQGGNRRNKVGDQKLERGNLALKNSMEMGYPVRVTYKKKGVKAANTLGMSNKENYVYVYDGLYTVKDFWYERDQNGKMVYKFELHRIADQPRQHQVVSSPRYPITSKEVCVINDVSQGKEKSPIRAMNGVNSDKPPPFTYTTNIIYPYWYQPIEPVGCNCVDGCSDALECPCVLKNGGEIPFTEHGAIVRAKGRVHECGPSCKCPPSCMNRVSQNGPHHQLEMFKTESKGWGLRSRTYISSGSFICEYVGELLREKEAELRVGDDEYLFDIYTDGYVIDAVMYGNIGRFINHSCSPNLYAQKIYYDHDDKRMPHIMFFATKDIPPLQELTYGYNYKMNRICDVNGNVKMKACYCGSPKCTGRMY